MSGFSFVDMLYNSVNTAEFTKQNARDVNNNNNDVSNYILHHKKQYEEIQPYTQQVKDETMKQEVSKPDPSSVSSSDYSIDRFIDQPKLEVQDPSLVHSKDNSGNSPQMYGGYYQGGYNVPPYYYCYASGGYTPLMGAHTYGQSHHLAHGKGALSQTSTSNQGEEHVSSNITEESPRCETTYPVVKMTAAAVKGETSGKPKRRNRTCFSKHQMDRLEELLEENRYPDVYRREEIARELDIEEDVVRVWFKNRRAKAKKVEKKVAAVSKARKNSSDESTEGNISPECTKQLFSANVQSLGLSSAVRNAPEFLQTMPGHPSVFSDMGMNLLKNDSIPALISSGTGKGIQYLAKPSEYYGDFNRDMSCSDSSASSTSNVHLTPGQVQLYV